MELICLNFRRNLLAYRTRTIEHAKAAPAPEIVRMLSSGLPSIQMPNPKVQIVEILMKKM